jgi:hypothetical protein
MDETIQNALVEAFPVSSHAMTLRAVREGIVLADDFLTSAPFMASPLGLDLRGQVRRVGIMFRIHEMAVAGDLPFTTAMPKMIRATWHQLEMRSGKFIGHLTRTESPQAFPEDRPSRQDERLRNQGDLFADPKIVPLSEAISDIKSMTAWLTYLADRNGQVQHLCWGVPAFDVDDWLGFINLLRSAEASVPVATKSVTSTPDPKAKLKFRDHINDALSARKDDASNDNDR